MELEALRDMLLGKEMPEVSPNLMEWFRRDDDDDDLDMTSLFLCYTQCYPSIATLTLVRTLGLGCERV